MLRRSRHLCRRPNPPLRLRWQWRSLWWSRPPRRPPRLFWHQALLQRQNRYHHHRPWPHHPCRHRHRCPLRSVRPARQGQAREPTPAKLPRPWWGRLRLLRTPGPARLRARAAWFTGCWRVWYWRGCPGWVGSIGWICNVQASCRWRRCPRSKPKAWWSRPKNRPKRPCPPHPSPWRLRRKLPWPLPRHQPCKRLPVRLWRL